VLIFEKDAPRLGRRPKTHNWPHDPYLTDRLFIKFLSVLWSAREQIRVGGHQ
jgi:hypothetical protein